MNIRYILPSIAALMLACSSAFAVKYDSIADITPVTCDMDEEDVEKTVKNFFNEVVNKPDNFLDMTAIVGNTKHKPKKGFSFEGFMLKDGSEWIQGTVGIERFLGYLYLKKAIEYYDLKIIRVAPTKFVLLDKAKKQVLVSVSKGDDHLANIRTINSKRFIPLSKYVGDERIKGEELTVEQEKELSILREKIGFTDILGYTNLRMKNGFIYVIDTEYASFASNVKACKIAEKVKVTITF